MVAKVVLMLLAISYYLVRAFSETSTMMGMNMVETWLVRCRTGVPFVRVLTINWATFVSWALVFIWAVCMARSLLMPRAFLMMVLLGLMLPGTDLLASSEELTVSDFDLMILLVGSCLFGWMANILLMVRLALGAISEVRECSVLAEWAPVCVLNYCLVSRKIGIVVVILRHRLGGLLRLESNNLRVTWQLSLLVLLRATVYMSYRQVVRTFISIRALTAVMLRCVPTVVVWRNG